MFVLLTLALAAGGGYLAGKTKIPAGVLMGAIFTVGIFQIATGLGAVPEWLRVGCTALTGTYLGTLVTKEDVLLMKTMILPILLIIGSMLGFNLLSGILIASFSDIDLTTALFATAPGGITEMTLVAIDMDANVSVVSAIQLLRLLVVLCAIPAFLRVLLTKFHTHAESEENAQPQSAPVAKTPRIREFAVTLVLGGAAGAVGRWTGLPAAVLCFSMFATAAKNILFAPVHFPVFWRKMAQTGNGALIGIRFSAVEFLLLKDVIWLVMGILAGWMAMSLLLGLLLHKFMKFQLETAMFSTAPGGATDMGLLAAEFGGNAAQVSVIHISRMLCVVALTPSIITLVTHLL